MPDPSHSLRPPMSTPLRRLCFGLSCLRVRIPMNSARDLGHPFIEVGRPV